MVVAKTRSVVSNVPLEFQSTQMAAPRVPPVTVIAKLNEPVGIELTAVLV